MSLHFHKRLSILPGVRLNFSPSGISTTIGVPGASVTLGGPGGPHANLGIPGSGLSLRVPFAGRAEPQPPRGIQPPMPPRRMPGAVSTLSTPSPMQAVRSAGIQTLTTQGLAAFRDLIIQARRDRDVAEHTVVTAIAKTEQAERAATSAGANLEHAERSLASMEASFFRFLKRGKIAATKTAIEQEKHKLAAAEAALKEAQEFKATSEARRDELWIDTEFQLEPDTEAAWTQALSAFENLSRSQRIWDVTAFRGKQIGAERSVATRVIDRQPTRLSVSALPIISSRFTPLRWHNANGGDLYLYPGFLIVFQHAEQFAMLQLDEISLECRPAQFQETEQLPNDAKRIGTTWTYTNKNGTPDRRYSLNPEIAVMMYAEIDFVSQTGLNEAFQFSNAEAATTFIDAFEGFRRALRLAASA